MFYRAEIQRATIKMMTHSLKKMSSEVRNSQTDSPFEVTVLLILSYISLILSLILPPTLGKVVQSLLCDNQRFF